MNPRKLVVVMAAGLLLQGGVAWAATPACAVDVPEAAHVIAGPFTRTSVEPASGATIAVRRDAEGRVTIELKDKTVTIRKTLERGSTITAFVAGGQKVTLTVKGDHVVVSAAGKTWEGGAEALDRINESAAYLQKSPVAIAAKRLLDRAVLVPDSLEGNALLLTKALLGSLFGEVIGTAQYQQWASARMSRSRVVRAAATSGPGECWDQYAAESIRIADDLTDCSNGCSWGYFCMAGCGFIYDIRAEGAFMWYMKCSGGFYVN